MPKEPSASASIPSSTPVASPSDSVASPAVHDLRGRRIVVGVSGGIAAYKVPDLVRLLVRAGASVHVVMTQAAQQFVTPLTLQTVSGHPVATDLFDRQHESPDSEIGHIALADRADLLLIAPATADLLSRLSLGLANDLLTTLALACRAPLLLAPAMNVNMWQHAAVQEHVARLQQRGAKLCGPDAGELACGWIGPGRMSEPSVIVDAAAALLRQTGSLAGRRILISAGPTYEAIDPVRFVGNRSSGKMGFALAAEAARRGAHVILAAGPVALPTPAGVQRVDYESAAQLADIVLSALDRQDLDGIVMTAAVADFRPSQVAAQKLKKRTLGDRLTIELEPTLDILAELGRRRGSDPRPLLVGFAAETTDVIAYAKDKLARKRCDVIVANDVSEAGSGFGSDHNRVTLLQRSLESGSDVLVDALPLLPKTQVAAAIWDRLEPAVTRAAQFKRSLSAQKDSPSAQKDSP